MLRSAHFGTHEHAGSLAKPVANSVKVGVQQQQFTCSSSSWGRQRSFCRLISISLIVVVLNSCTAQWYKCCLQLTCRHISITFVALVCVQGIAKCCCRAACYVEYVSCVMAHCCFGSVSSGMMSFCLALRCVVCYADTLVFVTASVRSAASSALFMSLPVHDSFSH